MAYWYAIAMNDHLEHKQAATQSIKLNIILKPHTQLITYIDLTIHIFKMPLKSL